MKFVLTALLTLLLCGPAAGAQIDMLDGSDPTPYATALAHARYMPTPPVVHVQPAPDGCPGAAAPACAYSTGTIFIKPAILPGFYVAMVHEVGHEVDFALGTPAIPGYNLEQVADAWAACALWGPNTADAEVVTPDYYFVIPADEFREDCTTLEAKSLAAGFDPRVAEPPSEGFCSRGGPCAKRSRWRWHRRWHW